jgi:acylphosphatase
MSSPRRIGFRVKGRVQGVGFRWFVRTAARRLDVAGFVRNEPDGDVVGEAVAAPAAIDAFLAELRLGPSLSRVDDVVVDDLAQAPSLPGGFEVRR